MSGPTHRPLEAVVLDLCGARGLGKTICPTEAAQAAAAERGGDDLAWRDLLQPVRRVAVALAREGRVVIYRKGRPVDPDDFRGVYRIGLGRAD